MHLVRSGAIEGFLPLVNRYGVNPHPILADVGLSFAQIRHPDNLISYQAVADLLDHAAEQCCAPFMGLELAADQGPWVIGDLALLGVHQPSIEKMMDVTFEHRRLHASGVHLERHVLGERCICTLRFDFSNAYGLAHLQQLSCGLLFNSVTSAVGGAPRGLNILLSCAGERQDTRIPAAYRGRVKFHSAHTGIEFPASWLQRKPINREEELRHFLDQRIQHLESIYPNDLSAQVCAIISGLLPSGECSLNRVSAALQLHPRILQRKLKAEGTRFAEILQDTRISIAQQYLLAGNTAIGDIALYLGYADPAVFSRHFRQWTGLSPRNWQKSQQTSTGA